MGKAKPQGRPRRPARPKGPKRPAAGAGAPLTDDQLGPLPGVPTDADIKRAVGTLSQADRKMFETLRQRLAEHLGSYAAARVWLVTPGGGFEGTPLEAITRGQVSRVLQSLDDQWGPSPVYA
jgi:hypothetical protein